MDRDRMIERAERIKDTVSTPGWGDILAILHDQINESQEQFFHIMVTKPESATGKTGIKYSSRAKALMDFRDEVQESWKILIPTGDGGSQ